MEDPDVPGVCLRGARGKEGLTQEQLARVTGLHQRHISEMENGKRTIGKRIAVLLAKALDVNYRIFLFAAINPHESTSGGRQSHPPGYLTGVKHFSC